MATCASCGRETPDRFPRCRICGAALDATPVAKQVPARKDLGMPKDSLDNRNSLPTAFRGYAREPVDQLMTQVEKSNRSLIAERDALRKDLENTKTRLSEATSELEQHRVTEEQALAAAASRAASLEEKSRGLAAERDELHAQLVQANRRLSEIEEELATHRQQQLALADALIAAEVLKAEGRDQGETLRLEAERKAAERLARAEREAQQIAARAEQEAETIRRDAHLEAEKIVSEAETSKVALENETEEIRARAEAQAEGLLADARIRADQVVRDAQKNVEENKHQAEDFFDDARSKLGSLFRDLLDQIAAMSEEPERAEPDQPSAQEGNEADRTPSLGRPA